VCTLRSEGCLYDLEHPYVTETHDWAKWLKMSISLIKVGKALYDKSVGDVWGNCQELYATFKGKEDADFRSFISQPFLTSAEQDDLINQLRGQRFFDLFMYVPQESDWRCVKCGRQVMKVSVKSESNGKVEIPSSPAPTSAKTKLMVNIGLFKRMTDMWCEYGDGEMRMYTSQKKVGKKPKCIIKKVDIVSVTEGDPRLTGNLFMYVVTKSRTYNVVALTPSDFALWKGLLSPD